MSTKNVVSKGSYVGIDIGNDTIKIAEVSADGSRLSIKGLACQPLPAGSISGENILNPKDIAQAVKEMLKASKISSKNCVISYTGSNRIMSKVYDVTRSNSDKQVAASVKYEIEKVFPYGATDTQVDWDEIPQKEEDENSIKVYAAAAHKALTKSLLDIVTGAGLKPVAIETGGLAAGRCAVPLGADDSQITAVLNIGALNTELNMFIGTSIASASYSYETNGTALTDAIAEKMGVEADEAEKLKKEFAYIDMAQIDEYLDKDEEVTFDEGEFDTPFDDPDFNPLVTDMNENDEEIGEDFSFDDGFDTDFTEGGELEELSDQPAEEEFTEDVDAEFEQEPAAAEEETLQFDGTEESHGQSYDVVMAMLPMLLDLSREIKVTFEDYYTATNNIVGKLVIIGGGAGIEGLKDFLGKQIGLECVCLDINSNYLVAGEIGAAMKDINTIYPVAIGLATRNLVE